jgi:hypothetical protein
MTQQEDSQFCFSSAIDTVGIDCTFPFLNGISKQVCESYFKGISTMYISYVLLFS